MANFIGSLFPSQNGQAIQVMGLDISANILTGTASGILDATNHRVVRLISATANYNVKISAVGIIALATDTLCIAGVDYYFTVPAGQQISVLGDKVNYTIMS